MKYFPKSCLYYQQGSKFLINILINRITLTREATKNEVETVYCKSLYPWMPQKLPIVICFTKHYNSAKNHRSVSAK